MTERTLILTLLYNVELIRLVDMIDSNNKHGSLMFLYKYVINKYTTSTDNININNIPKPYLINSNISNIIYYEMFTSYSRTKLVYTISNRYLGLKKNQRTFKAPVDVTLPNISFKIEYEVPKHLYKENSIIIDTINIKHDVKKFLINIMKHYNIYNIQQAFSLYNYHIRDIKLNQI